MNHKPYDYFEFWLGIIWMISSCFREHEYQTHGMLLSCFFFLWSFISTVTDNQKDIYEKLKELDRNETRI